MLQKMAKRVRRARNWRVEIKFAPIDENEHGGGKNGFRRAPPWYERLRFWILCRLRGDNPHPLSAPWLKGSTTAMGTIVRAC